MALLIVGALLIAAAIALWLLPRKSRWHWKLPMRIGAAVLMCASGLTVLLFLFGSLCGRYEFPPISSRDGKLTAQLSEEDCGATDSFHSSLELWQTRGGLLRRVFGGRRHLTTVFTVGHDPRLIELSWKDDRTLVIRYPSDSRNPDEFRCQSQWEGIQIECVGYAPDYSKPVGKMPPVQRGLW
jgi:hypothetical protein